MNMGQSKAAGSQNILRDHDSLSHYSSSLKLTVIESLVSPYIGGVFLMIVEDQNFVF